MLLSFNMTRSNASSSSKLFAGLTALAFVILVLGTADAALGVARTYMSAELTSPVSVAPVLEQQVEVLAAQPRGQTRADVRVDVVETDDTPVRTVVMIVDTVQAAAIGLGLLLAIRVLKSTAQGHAFTADHVR